MRVYTHTPSLSLSHTHTHTHTLTDLVLFGLRAKSVWLDQTMDTFLDELQYERLTPVNKSLSRHPKDQLLPQCPSSFHPFFHRWEFFWGSYTYFNTRVSFFVLDPVGVGRRGHWAYFQWSGRRQIEGCNGATAVNPKKSFDVEQKGGMKQKRNATDGFNARTIPILCRLTGVWENGRHIRLFSLQRANFWVTKWITNSKAVVLALFGSADLKSLKIISTDPLNV